MTKTPQEAYLPQLRFRLGIDALSADSPKADAKTLSLTDADPEQDAKGSLHKSARPRDELQSADIVPPPAEIVPILVLEVKSVTALEVNPSVEEAFHSACHEHEVATPAEKKQEPRVFECFVPYDKDAVDMETVLAEGLDPTQCRFYEGGTTFSGALHHL